jgi:hypothetical protein
MRAALALALCFVLGGCATFGGGGPDPYGIYDVVSANGEDWPTPEGMRSWYELRADGTSTATFIIPTQAEPAVNDATFSLGEKEDGCIPFSATGEDKTEWTGSICGDVLSIEGPEMSVVLHKRR